MKSISITQIFTFFLIFSLKLCTCASWRAIYPRTPAWMRVAASPLVRRKCSGNGACGLRSRDRQKSNFGQKSNDFVDLIKILM